MKLVELDFERNYTYADFQRWSFSEPLELIGGKIFRTDTTPPPRTLLRLSRQFSKELAAYFEKTGIEVISGTHQVLLSRDVADPGVIPTVVFPSLMVSLDPTAFDGKIYTGVPDIMIEILAAGGHSKELVHKYAIYERAGVREYWVIVPSVEACFQYILDSGGKYVCRGAVTADQALTTDILPGLSLDFQRIIGWRQGDFVHQ